MAACSEVHKAFGLQSFPRLQVMRNDDVTVPILCRHCDEMCIRDSSLPAPEVAIFARISAKLEIF